MSTAVMYVIWRDVMWCEHEAKLNVHHWGVLGVDNNKFWMLNMVYHLWLVEATNEMHVENISVEGKNVQM